MLTWNLADYSEPLAQLWRIERLPALGPGTPNSAAKPLLRALSHRDFPNLREPRAARACLSGLWLFHDFLDESHTLSQEIPEWYGSYWHAIMHRREPDAWNSQYWFRRVPRGNPVYERLGEQQPYDPCTFVETCERERDTGSDAELACREWQRREMQLLFAWCYRHAVGAS